MVRRVEIRSNWHTISATRLEDIDSFPRLLISGISIQNNSQTANSQFSSCRPTGLEDQQKTAKDFLSGLKGLRRPTKPTKNLFFPISSSWCLVLVIATSNFSVAWARKSEPFLWSWEPSKFMNLVWRMPNTKNILLVMVNGKTECSKKSSMNILKRFHWRPFLKKKSLNWQSVVKLFLRKTEGMSGKKKQ